jgi:hypothetical protein
MLALSKQRETSARWQHAVELLLDWGDVADFSKQVELALFYDGRRFRHFCRHVVSG